MIDTNEAITLHWLCIEEAAGKHGSVLGAPYHWRDLSQWFVDVSFETLESAYRRNILTQDWRARLGQILALKDKDLVTVMRDGTFWRFAPTSKGIMLNKLL
jgi:hypothetical protein